MHGDVPSSSVGVIASDRPCVKCGYNLRGLRVGGRCPECGAAIRPRRSKRFADNLTDAPMWYLRLMALGFGSMAVAVVGAVVWTILVAVQSARRTPVAPLVAAGVYASFPLLWCVGTFLVTWKRPHGPSTIRDPLLDHAGLRLAARLCQSLFLVAVGLFAVAGRTGSATLAAVSGVTLILALFGSVPLCVYTSSLADWAGETAVGGRLRASAWMLAVCGALCTVSTLITMTPNPAPLLFVLIAVVTGLGTFVGVVLQLTSVVQLANTSFWAIGNAVQAKAREVRIAEKKAKEEAKQAARDQAAAAAIASVPAVAVEVEEPGDLAEAIPLAEAEADEVDEVDAILDGLAASGAAGGHAAFEDGDSAISLSDDSGPGADDVTKRPRPKGAHVVERHGDNVDPYELAPDDD